MEIDKFELDLMEQESLIQNIKREILSYISQQENLEINRTNILNNI